MSKTTRRARYKSNGNPEWLQSTTKEIIMGDACYFRKDGKLVEIDRRTLTKNTPYIDQDGTTIFEGDIVAKENQESKIILSDGEELYIRDLNNVKQEWSLIKDSSASNLSEWKVTGNMFDSLTVDVWLEIIKSKKDLLSKSNKNNLIKQLKGTLH